MSQTCDLSMSRASLSHEGGSLMNMKQAIKVTIGGLLVLAGSHVMADEAETYQINAIMEGELAGAEKKLVQVLKDNPEDPYAMLNLAFIYQRSGYDDKARELYKRILSLPENPMARLASGKPERIKYIARRGLGTVLPE